MSKVNYFLISSHLERVTVSCWSLYTPTVISTHTHAVHGVMQKHRAHSDSCNTLLKSYPTKKHQKYLYLKIILVKSVQRYLICMSKFEKSLLYDYLFQGMNE